MQWIVQSVKCVALCVGGRRILHPDAVTTTPVTQPFSNLTGDQHKVFAEANKEVRRGDLNKTWSGPSWISPTKAPNQGREQAALARVDHPSDAAIGKLATARIDQQSGTLAVVN